MMPMFCFAFFFENILIPVSKSFSVKDENGALGMRSSLLSLLLSLLFYGVILASAMFTKINYNNIDKNPFIFITAY
jgi:hypothetical protein